MTDVLAPCPGKALAIADVPDPVFEQEMVTGHPMIRWDPSTISGPDISPVVPVVVMDAPRGSVTSEVVGADVVIGDLPFTTA